MRFKKTDTEQHHIDDGALVFDVETDSLNTETARIRWFGAYSFPEKCYYFISEEHIEAMQELIDRHRVLVGFNSKSFDIPICKNNGLNLDYKVQIDLLRVLHVPETRRPVRENIIKANGKVLRDILPNHKLKTIAAVLGFKAQKGDIDYRIFRQESWSAEEIQQILKYLHGDLEITKRLFEFFYDEFLPFRHLMSERDQRNYNWMRTTTGSYAYKVICHHADLPEEYAEDYVRQKYEGGYVSEPAGEFFSGRIYLFDITSAYPHAFLSGNLYSHSCSCCTDNEKWTGNHLFPITGKYCQKSMGKIERVIQSLYLKRAELKEKKDPSEYAYKVIINSQYGISGSPVFKSIYSRTTASDCTLIVRSMIKLARDMFHSAGYTLIYTDTDSVFIADPFDDQERMLNVRTAIVEKINANLPIPQETFNIKIDDEIKAIWFFRDYNNELKKKNYVYISNEGGIIIKGLPIIRRDSSRLSQKIFNILLPEILEQSDIKFPEERIRELVSSAIDEDMSIIANHYAVKSPDSYKSKSSIQSQIASSYGEGEHWLIPNKIKGRVGKGKKYCTVAEGSGLSVDDLDLRKIWETEISMFIKDWTHPLFTRAMERAEESYRRKQEKEMQKFFKSDLWDHEAVGSDITDSEFLENMISFEIEKNN